MAVDVISLVLGLKELAELLELLLHLKKARDLSDVLLGLEGLDDLAQSVLVVAVELRAVVSDAAEFLNVVHGVIGRNAHDRAHLIAASVVVGRPALAAYPVVLLQDRVVLVTLLLQIHACRKSRRTSADNTDLDVLVHFALPFIVKLMVLLPKQL